MVGDIVCANHYDVFNRPKVSIFLVIYDEELDPSNSHSINVTALKITTNKDNACYEVPIDLLEPSYILCSKFYTLNKLQIFKKIGHIDNMRQIEKQLKKYYKEMRRQIKCLK